MCVYSWGYYESILLNIAVFYVQKLCRKAYMFISGLVCNFNVFPLEEYLFFFFFGLFISSAKVFAVEMDRYIAAIHVFLYNGFYAVNTVAVRIGYFKALCSYDAFKVIFPVPLLALCCQNNKTSNAFTVKGRSHFSCASEQ